MSLILQQCDSCLEYKTDVVLIKCSECGHYHQFCPECTFKHLAPVPVTEAKPEKKEAIN